MTTRSSSARTRPAVSAKDAAENASAQPARVSSEKLLGATGVLIIEHRGREYRLRKTGNGKLILTA